MRESGKFVRFLEIFRNDGLVPLFRSSKEYVSNTAENCWLALYYRLKYGDVAPRRDEGFSIDPRDIEYTIYSKHMYTDTRTYPNYGILGGSWDRDKQHWRDSAIWDGLRERFEEGKPWKETSYYRTAMEKLDSGGSLGRLDGPQTVDHFERYLRYLDELYDDIREHGYDRSSVITVHVGREGEWIVGRGNHRRTIAHVLGVESVPVRIKYRHRKWQEIRRRFADANSIDEVHKLREYRSHPDIPEIPSH